MGVAAFNSIPSKRRQRGERKHSLPVIAASIEVFVCRPMNGLKITRSACAKIAANPPVVGPCSRCFVGASHVRGRLPGTWPDGQPIALTTIEVPGRV